MSSSLPFNPMTPLGEPPTSDQPVEAARAQEKRNWRLQIIPTLLLVLVGLLALALSLAPSTSKPFISEFSLFLSMLFCFGCTLWAMLRTPRGRARWAWGLLALGQLLYAVGNVGDVILEFQGVSASIVTVPDLLQLPFAPLTMLGILFFPAPQSVVGRQVRLIVDVAIVVGALFGAAWVFLISPHIGVGDIQDVVFTVVPVTDVALMLVLIVVLARGVQEPYHPALLSLAIGTLCFTYADTAFNYLSTPALQIGPLYSAGVPSVDPFWVAGAFAYALAPLTLLRDWTNALPSWTWPSKLIPKTNRFLPGGLLGRFLVTALPVLVLFGLLVLIKIDRTLEDADVVLLVVTVLVVLLIIARQLLTMTDLLQARVATERAEQLDSLKDQFITSVNHELRTPLMTMKGYLSLLTNPTVEAEQEKRLDMLTRANRSCENLVYLVQSILDTRRIDQEASNFEPEAVNIQTAMQAALTLVDPREADLASRYITTYIPSDLVIWGESVRMQQILTNLMSNAIKYSSEGTPIRVEAHRVSGRTQRLLGDRSSAQPMVEIMVQAQGLGIPLDQQALLFRRFVRLSRDIASTVRGTGLGLYLCRIFVEAMGGSIWVESSGIAGEGSTFYLRLPMPPESAPIASASPEVVGTSSRV